MSMCHLLLLFLSLIGPFSPLDGTVIFHPSSDYRQLYLIDGTVYAAMCGEYRDGGCWPQKDERPKRGRYASVPVPNSHLARNA